MPFAAFHHRCEHALTVGPVVLVSPWAQFFSHMGSRSTLYHSIVQGGGVRIFPKIPFRVFRFYFRKTRSITLLRQSSTLDPAQALTTNPTGNIHQLVYQACQNTRRLALKSRTVPGHLAANCPFISLRCDGGVALNGEEPDRW